jgi:hypothetical protein
MMPDEMKGKFCVMQGVQPLVTQLSDLLINRIKEQLPITQQQVCLKVQVQKALEFHRLN